MLEEMEALRRATDGELCGYAEQRDGQWIALTVFGAELGGHDDRASAVAQVLDERLPSPAECWTLRRGDAGEEEVVRIQEVNDDRVTAALVCHSLPGVPTLAITKAQLASGEWQLHL